MGQRDSRAQNDSVSLRMTMFSYELTCRNCGWRTVCGRDDAIARLRIVGQLRREREPEDDLVETLFVEAAPQMTCPICKEKSLCCAAISGLGRRTWRLADRRFVRDLSRADCARAIGSDSRERSGAQPAQRRWSRGSSTKSNPIIARIVEHLWKCASAADRALRDINAFARANRHVGCRVVTLHISARSTSIRQPRRG